MRYRPFGGTDLRVSELGLGGGRLGATLRESTGREVTRMLQEAMDSGISFYDTADSYGQGKSEELIGDAFRDRRDRVVLLRSTRPLRRMVYRVRSSQLSRDFSARHINDAADASLRRLQTDYIDLYQLHNPPTAVLRDGQVFAVLDRLRSAGKVRYYGVSCHTVEDALLALRDPGVAAVQVKLNLLDRRAIGGLLPEACRRRVAVIARQPLAGGFLTQSPAELSLQAATMDQDRFQERLRAAGQFRYLAKGSRTLAQAAIQFALGQEGVAVVLPGISSVRHLREAIGALTAPPLTDQELAMIQAS
jgi:aryl-alcohol dehydrogenase-like predicted oxidoreductase